MEDKGPWVLVSAPPSRERGLRAGMAIAAVGVLVVGIAIGALATGGSTTTTGPPPGEAGPARITAPPQGFSHSRDGALAAAVAYADAFGAQQLIDPRRFGDLVDAIAMPELATRMRSQEASAQNAAGTREIQAAARKGGVYAQSMPLAYRVLSYRPERAVVDLWELSVLTGGAVEPFARFSRSRSTLTWSGGDWKLAGLGRPLSGPTPGIERHTATSSSQGFIRELRRYRELRSAP